jgi:hypothetical protein
MKTPVNPTCDQECRFQFSGGMQTLAYYAPIYDKNGNNLNPDMNTTYGDVTCNTCGKSWSYATQNGKTVYTEK